MKPPMGRAMGPLSFACLTGAWTTKFGDKNVYTFNTDKTGNRVYMEQPPSAFTWSADGANVTIDFPKEGDSPAAKFTGKVDCAKKSFWLDGGGELTKP